MGTTFDLQDIIKRWPIFCLLPIPRRCSRDDYFGRSDCLVSSENQKNRHDLHSSCLKLPITPFCLPYWLISHTTSVAMTLVLRFYFRRVVYHSVMRGPNLQSTIYNYSGEPSWLRLITSSIKPGCFVSLLLANLTHILDFVMPSHEAGRYFYNKLNTRTWYWWWGKHEGFCYCPRELDEGVETDLKISITHIMRGQFFVSILRFEHFGYKIHWSEFYRKQTGNHYICLQL